MQNKRTVAIGAAILAALLAVFGIVWFSTRPETSAGSKTITVEVVHKDESRKTFTCKTDAEYLAEVLVSEGIVVDNQQQYGLYIEEVDGEKAVFEDDGGYWAVLQGGEPTTAGASETPIHDGDSFSLVYTIYSASE